MSGIHIFRAGVYGRKRVRVKCPVDDRLTYGTAAADYDTTWLFLDCGTSLNFGYGEWFGHRGPRGGRGPRRSITRRVWDIPGMARVRRWAIRQVLRNLE